MANKRMFSSDIVGSDAFLDMPNSTQALYFQLCMYADDKGFVQPKKVVRLLGATEDELKLLVVKRFVIEFQNGVFVVKHWWINNKYDRSKIRETSYIDESENLRIKENRAYTLDISQGVPFKDFEKSGYRLNKVLNKSEKSPKKVGRIEENRIEENRIDKNTTTHEAKAIVVKKLKEYKTKTDPAVVQELIEMFKPVNEMVNTLYRQTTQRRAIDDLMVIANGDVTNLKNAIALLPQMNASQKVFTKITTPAQMVSGWAKAKAQYFTGEVFGQRKVVI